MQAKKNTRPFGMIDQVGYALGDVGGSFINLFIDAWVLVFATDVLGISPYFMSALFLGARLFDAINDPIIGSFPDRFKLGKGTDKFKPWIKIFMLPLALSALLVFADVSSWGITAKHVWISVAYIFYGVCYTGTSMPYGSMAAVISQDPIERTKISRSRAIGGMIVGFGFLTFVPKFVFNAQHQLDAGSLFKVAIVFAILSFVSYIGLLKLSVERYNQKPVAGEKFKYADVIKGLFKNRHMLGVMFATIGSLIYITANNQLAAYIMKESYKRPDLLTLKSIMAIPVSLLGIVFAPWLAKKFGKRRTLIYSIAANLVIAAVLTFYFIPNPYVYLVVYTLSTIGQMLFTVMIWALVTDCLDYHEYIMHQRSDGSLYSLYAFARKLGSTFASSLGALALGMVGYDQAVKVQAAGVGERIYTLVNAIPLVVCVIELIGLIFIFKLDEKKVHEISTELKRRHESA